MLKIFGLILLIFISYFSCFSQAELKIKNSYGYEADEVNQVRKNLEMAFSLIEKADDYLHDNYDLKEEGILQKWNNDTTLTIWLGKAKSKQHIKRASRRLKKMNKLSLKIAHLSFDREKKRGLCKGSRHAWTVPNGKLLVHLCPQFMYKSNRLQTKIFVHEVGHESGILFHKKVYWKSAALRTARDKPKLALKNPENIAFFIMTFYPLNRN